LISSPVAPRPESRQHNRILPSLMNRSTKTSPRRSLVPVLAAALLGFGLQDLSAQELLAVRGGTVHTMKDGVLENATVLIQDGQILEVGTDIEVPWNATVVDAEGKVVLVDGQAKRVKRRFETPRTVVTLEIENELGQPESLTSNP